MAGNILLVDDELSSLKLLMDMLIAEGHKVRPFNNGELALRSIKAETPELVVLDIRMPDMDGLEVCRCIKEDEKLSEIPVIFISAASDMEDKLMAFQAGGVDYITKPFQKEEVLARVTTHLALSRSRQKMKHIEDALRTSVKNLKMAQTIARLGHWEWDLTTDHFTWSDETYRILGYEPEHISTSYDTFLRSVHPDDRERVASILNQVRNGLGFNIEYKILLPNGGIRVVHGKCEVVCLDDSTQAAATEQTQSPNRKRLKALGVIQDITARKELEWQLERQANTDCLTGSINRRQFFKLAGQEFARVRRYGGIISVLMLDVDYFKAVNDSYGHQAGDLALKKLVAVCQSILREVDIIGRLGGEEFSVLLPETGREGAIEIAERLRLAIAMEEVPLDEGSFRFTASIGIATLSEQDTGLDMILKRADQALYEAKNAGRNRVCVK